MKIPTSKDPFWKSFWLGWWQAWQFIGIVGGATYFIMTVSNALKGYF